MYSKHSALGSRVLGIHRSNDVILPLETKVKAFCGAENRRHFTVNFIMKEAKEAVQK